MKHYAKIGEHAYDETQDSIETWRREAFGPVRGNNPLLRAVLRVQKELTELEWEASELTITNVNKLASECADVLITLYGVASYLGFDLHGAVDDKMRVNRQRSWASDGTGHGQHVDSRTA